jgi:hypothetical protein
MIYVIINMLTTPELCSKRTGHSTHAVSLLLLLLHCSQLLSSALAS